jgi:hypothetical protein
MKKRGTVLSKHYRQALNYWQQICPGRPRYVVLCNFDEFHVYDFDAQMDSPVGIAKLADLAEHYGPLNVLFPGQPKPVFDQKTARLRFQGNRKSVACTLCTSPVFN